MPILISLLTACAEDGLSPLEPNERVLQQAGEIINVSPPTTADLTNLYVVVFREEVADPRRLAEELVRAHGGQIHYVYRYVLKGFGATLPLPAATAIGQHPLVVRITPAKRVVAVGTQTSPPWGLDRIDQRDLPLNGTYNYSETGSGVRAYIVDSGILTSHVEFGGRASIGYDAFGGDGQDCHGHGTHVAGIAGAATYGVAKDVQLISVRVLNCNGEGTTAGFLAGLDWVRANHVKPAVANLSLALTRGDEEIADADIDNATNSIVSSGVTTVAAAGNTNKDACGVSPARAASALTTAATNSSDYRWVWSSTQGSNYGNCVDLFAPGEGILSTDISPATNYRSGTSMAAPHVTGVAATYLQRNPTASPAAVENVINQNMTLGTIENIGSGSTNRFLMSDLTNPVDVYIEGPYFVNEVGTYVWEAMPSGGNGSYTYRWEVLWTNTWNRELLGSWKTQELYLTGEHGDFELSVTIFSGNAQTMTSFLVCNFIPPNDAGCA